MWERVPPASPQPLEPHPTGPFRSPVGPERQVPTGDTGGSRAASIVGASRQRSARSITERPRSMTTQNGRAFNEWLRTQLKAKKMSQRQLAQQSGVDHSTISRLIRGDRMPSLGTATKLARGLRELRDDADTTQYLGLVASGSMNPTARVEYALRADDLLTEPQVRQIMEYYLAVRIRRYGRAFSPDGNTTTSTSSTERELGSTDAADRDRPPDEFLQRPRRGRCGGRPPGHPGHRPGARPLLATLGARPGSPSSIRVSGAANASVWGAGVRDSRGCRPVARAPRRHLPRCHASHAATRMPPGPSSSSHLAATPAGTATTTCGRAPASGPRCRSSWRPAVGSARPGHGDPSDTSHLTATDG